MKLILSKLNKKVGRIRSKFRSQFGRKPVQRAIRIIKEKKKRYLCPTCSYDQKVVRVSTAIFRCKKCNSTYVSQSYLFNESKK